MLSVEDKVSAIEKSYIDIRSTLESMMLSMKYPGDYAKYVKPQAVDKIIKLILAYQCQLELLYEDVKELDDEKTKSYVERLKWTLNTLRNAVRGRDDRIMEEHNPGVLDFINSGEYDWALENFKNLRTKMYAFFEDVKMIYAMRLLPIEEKMALKSQLSDYGFLEVVKCLDEAESNLAMREPEYLKDCVDRSREALEKTVASILVAEEKKPSGYFSTDIGTMSGFGIVDKESRRLMEASYSYLSEVGAHGRGGGEITLGDVHYALKETYMRIDILLKRYAAYLTGKK